MPIDLVGPDLVISLHLDPYAPRAARYHVAQVDRPSPDLRDAVILLTSELVTRAVAHRRPDCDEAAELRVWMPAEVVRVELRARPELLCLPPERNGTHYDLLLLDQIADRWSIDTAEELACIWFEIDRHLTERKPEPALQRHSNGPRRRSLSRRWRSVTATG
jgi:hypothetical protein